MLSKLEFGHSFINFVDNFFPAFDEHLKTLDSEEFIEGVDELKEVVKVFGIRFFEEALLEREYTFENLTWPLPRKKEK